MSATAQTERNEQLIGIIFIIQSDSVRMEAAAQQRRSSPGSRIALAKNDRCGCNLRRKKKTDTLALETSMPRHAGVLVFQVPTASCGNTETGHSGGLKEVGMSTSPTSPRENESPQRAEIALGINSRKITVELHESFPFENFSSRGKFQRLSLS